jgi:hypothetical protein
MMSLLGIDVTTTADPGPLQRRDMENAISRVVAEVIWIGTHSDRTKGPLTQITAGEIGEFQRMEVQSFPTY